MSILAIEIEKPLAGDVSVTNDSLHLDMNDGRSMDVPLAWFPRLLQGSPEERANFRLIGGGEGIHWIDLDEDISVEGLIAGHPSGESQASFNRWLSGRNS